MEVLDFEDSDSSFQSDVLYERPAHWIGKTAHDVQNKDNELSLSDGLNSRNDNDLLSIN